MPTYQVQAVERILIYQIIEAETPEEAEEKAHDSGDWIGDEYIEMEQDSCKVTLLEKPVSY